MPTTKDWSLAVLILAVAALALDSMIDAQETESSEYCEMIALWGKDAESGIAPEQRHGWPPYDGHKQCETEE